MAYNDSALLSLVFRLILWWIDVWVVLWEYFLLWWRDLDGLKPLNELNVCVPVEEGGSEDITFLWWLLLEIQLIYFGKNLQLGGLKGRSFSTKRDVLYGSRVLVDRVCLQCSFLFIHLSFWNFGYAETLSGKIIICLTHVEEPNFYLHANLCIYFMLLNKM